MQDLPPAQGASSQLPMALGRLLNDLRQDLPDPKPDLLDVEVLPAGEGGEFQALFVGELIRGDLFSASASSILARSVVPHTDHRLAGAQGGEAACPGLVLRLGHQVLFASLLEQVLQPVDRDRPVAAAPEPLAPAVQASRLLA